MTHQGIFTPLTPEQPARKKSLTMKDTCLGRQKEMGWGGGGRAGVHLWELAGEGGQGTSQDKSQVVKRNAVKKPESLRCEEGSPA